MARRSVGNGEWVQPRRKKYEMECCDCGLVHVLNFKLITTPNGGKSIIFQAFRDNRRTAQTRRRRRIRFSDK